MDAIKFIIVVVVWFLLSLFPVTGQAQENVLDSFRTVEGQIEAGQSNNWVFEARDGAVVSFQAQAARSGNLDPIIVLTDDNGQILARNDDYDFPTLNDAVLQAITIPRTGRYLLTVSGFGDTAGEYNLTMLNGFPEIVEQELFNILDGWETPSDTLSAVVDSGTLVLAATGIRQHGFAVNSDSETVRDFYAQVNIEITSSRPGWVAGLTARHQSENDYYQVNINDRGLWQLIVHTGTEEFVIRDWTAHPAIVPGVRQFTFGLMMQGSGIDVFYNDGFVGHVVDDSLPSSGAVGLSIGTGTAIDSETVVQFDNLVITTPIQVENGRIIPDYVVPANPNRLSQDLRRQGLIPADAVIILTVPESFIESINSGVGQIALGGGITATNLVMATNLTWRTNTDGAVGCGMIFRATDENRFTLAYLDQTGAYGISHREGESFSAGLFGQLPVIESRSHHLLVVATAHSIYYYVDGQYVGVLESSSIEGTVGNAVVNFEPISTSCQFSDTWVERWN